MAQEWDIGASALARLCAPLPARNDWQWELTQVRSLGIGAVELMAGWPQLLLHERLATELGKDLQRLGLRVALSALPEGALRVGELQQYLPALARLGACCLVLPREEIPPANRQRFYGDLAQLAEEYGLTLLLQNNPLGWPADGASLGQFIAQVNRPGLRACFDPAGFVALKKHPFLTEFLPGPLKRQIACLRLRDALFEDGSEVLPNQGNAELKELVSALEARSYQGWYALSVFGSGPYAERLPAIYESAKEVLGSL
ncbi:MAG: sugar phosphate isomerase/epimerase family protein [Anaerolineae bacterium]